MKNWWTRASCRNSPEDTLLVTVEKRAYSLILDVVLDNRESLDLENPASMAGSLLPAMESLLHLGLGRVTRRAETDRRSREAA